MADSIKLQRNRVKTFTLTYVNAAGTAIPLTGHDIKMEFRVGAGSPVLATVDNGANGGVSIAGNVVTFTISAAKTAALPTGPITTDIKAQNGGADPFTLAAITFLVSNPVTA